MGEKRSSEDILKSLQAILDLIAADLSPDGAEKAKKLRKNLDELKGHTEQDKSESDPPTDSNG